MSDDWGDDWHWADDGAVEFEELCDDLTAEQSEES